MSFIQNWNNSNIKTRIIGVSQGYAEYVTRLRNFVGKLTPDKEGCTCLVNAVTGIIKCIDFEWTVPKMFVQVDDSEVYVKAKYKGKFGVQVLDQYAKYDNNCLTVCLDLVLELLSRSFTLALQEENCRRLADYVNDILKKNNISYTVDFAVTSSIFDLTDTHIGLPLLDSIVVELAEIFDEGNLQFKLYMESSIVDTFNALPCILECMRRRTEFTTRLKLYTWRSAKTLFREGYHSKVENISNGFGYTQDKNVFGLKELRTCDEKELAVLREKYGDDLIVSDNTEPRSCDYIVAKSEAELQQLKIRFDKHTGCTYRVEQLDNGYYRLVYRQYKAEAYCFKPINLMTYEQPNKRSIDISALMGV